MRSAQFSKMRDRRNTNLSVSSTDSASSAGTATTSRSKSNSLSEKRYSSPPPPSPTLPAPATTKENRPRPQPRRVMAIKGVTALFAILLVWRWMLGDSILQGGTKPAAEQDINASTELVAGSDLPDEPTAFMVQGPDDTPKWTISIPHEFAFPLPGHYYEDMCTHGAGLSNTISSTSRHPSDKHWWRKAGYYTKDRTFIDIADAEKAGLLPKFKEDPAEDICETSMTFVLDSNDASFGTSLLQLWLSYGLAKQEGRAFFIDDSRWAWGNYSSYFSPPPSPKCARPPPHHVVPCPRSAKHLVVSSATAPWTFGPVFHMEFQNLRKHGVAAQSRIYELLRTGYEDLFKLATEDALYADARIAKLKLDAAANGEAVVGMQIRRGDAHPYEYQYSRDYLPLERYTKAAKSLLPPEVLGKSFSFLLASDDPDMLESWELQQGSLPYIMQRAQDRIQLATKAILDLTSPVSDLREPGSAYTKHVDENTGWERGFYPGLFFSMGGGRRDMEPNEVPEQAMKLREYVGRAYLLDLAVLSAGDGVVCAVSSASCRALGVMMGWNAVRDGRWVNVDDGRSWTWNGQR